MAESTCPHGLVWESCTTCAPLGKEKVIEGLQSVGMLVGGVGSIARPFRREDFGLAPDPSPTEEELEALRVEDALQVHARILSAPAKHPPHNCYACALIIGKLKERDDALRTTREIARVATRERDEARELADVQRAMLVDAEQRRETDSARRYAIGKEQQEQHQAQLTDRDRMIAALREVLTKAITAGDHACKDSLGRSLIASSGTPCGRCNLESEIATILSTSHPIAAAFEAQIAQERDRYRAALRWYTSADKNCPGCGVTERKDHKAGCWCYEVANEQQ